MSHLWHHLYHHGDRTSSATEDLPEIQISVELEAYTSAALNTEVENMRRNTAGSIAVYKFSFWTAKGYFGDRPGQPAIGCWMMVCRRVCTTPPVPGTRCLLRAGAYVLPDQLLAVQSKVFCPVKYSALVIALHTVQKLCWTTTFKFYFSRIKFLGHPCKAFCSEAERVEKVSAHSQTTIVCWAVFWRFIAASGDAIPSVQSFSVHIWMFVHRHLFPTPNVRFLQVPYPCVKESLIFHRDVHQRELHPKELNQLLLWKLTW